MRILYIIAITLLFISCADNRPSYENVTISNVFSDSLSVRAILPIDENRVWFAADKGMVGFIDGNIPKLATVKYEDQLLHFRSIGKNNSAIFVLSIGSPAVLYKIDFNGTEATNMSEVYSEIGENVFYDSLRFWNDQEGIAIGDPVDGCLSIIVTRDGGKSWSKLACNSLPKVEEGEAAFAASNSNIAIVGDHVWVASGGKKARVFHSADKGKVWEVFDTPIIQGKTMTGIYSIDFYDEKRGIIFGGDWENKPYNEGNKAVTKDGGKTWKLVSNGEGPGYRSSVRFVPGGNGKEIIAVGSPGISFSSDFGDSWIEVSPEGFYAIEFVNDSIAFASGNRRISKLQFD